MGWNHQLANGVSVSMWGWLYVPYCVLSWNPSDRTGLVLLQGKKTEFMFGSLQRDMPIGSMYDHNWIEGKCRKRTYAWMIWVRGVFMDTLYYTSNMKPSRWIRRCHASWFTCFTIVGRNRFVEKRAAAPVMYIVGNLFDKNQNGGYVVSFWWPV